MYDVTAVRDRDLLLRQSLRQTRLTELLRPAETVVHTTAPVADALQMFLDYPVKYLYVVDDHNVYQGIIAQQDLTSLLLGQSEIQHKRAGDVLRRNFVKTLHPDMTLDQAQDYFLQFQGERLPVVSRDPEPKLLGVVYKSALLEKYSALKKSLDTSGEAMLDQKLLRRPHK
jgi:CIC family chloride channel protein